MKNIKDLVTILRNKNKNLKAEIKKDPKRFYKQLQNFNKLNTGWGWSGYGW